MTDDHSYATGAARAIARHVRLTVEAQKANTGERSAARRQQQRWETLSAVADLIEALTDDDPAIVACARAHQLRGGSAATWAPGEAQNRAIWETFTSPAQKTPEQPSEVVRRLLAATIEDTAAHARIERDDALRLDLAAAHADLEHANETLLTERENLRLALEREHAHNEAAASMQRELDDMRQRLAGVLMDPMAELAIAAARAEREREAEVEA